MGACFLYGNGGGSDLNFTTRAYATEAELQASTPKENTLGVVTSVPPIAWSFYNVAPGWSEADGIIYFVVPLLTSLEATSFNTTKKYNLWLAPTECYQRISGAWRSMIAYIYKGGTWVRFSNGVTATINVTYPAGSTCSATDGTTTLTAPDTSGTWTCVVLNAGTWTITATDGTDTATASITITEDGQSESVTLTYRLPYFYYNGSKNVTLSGSSYSDSGGYITITSTDDGTGNRAPTVSFAIPEIQKYNTIKCTINSFGGSNPTIAIQDSAGTAIASVTVSSTTTYGIDISSKSLSGNGYKFVLGTNSYFEQTDPYGGGHWVAGTVKTNHIWGE